MGGRRMEESREWRTHLASDLWIRILCLLPVKSLLVVRSVCRFFLSIIDNPNFVSEHLRTFPGNVDETLTLVHRFEFRGCHNRDLGNIRYEIRESNGSALPGRLDPGFKPFDFRILTGSLDGLVLLTARSGGDAAWLWNPSMRKVRILPLPDPISRSKSVGFRLSGLAYDSSCDDYKVLYIPYTYEVYLRRLLPSGVWVYSVKTRTWTAINMKASGLGKTRAYSCYLWSLFFEGALLWIEAWYSASDQYCIRMVRFDLATHKFSFHAPLPCPAEKHIHMEAKLVTLDCGSSLGLCGLDDHDRVSIWAYAASTSSWVQRCVIHQYPMHSLGYGIFGRVTKNDELTWKYRSSDGVIKILICNLRTHHCLESQISPSELRYIHEGDHCAYLESLVML